MTDESAALRALGKKLALEQDKALANGAELAAAERRWLDAATPLRPRHKGSLGWLFAAAAFVCLGAWIVITKVEEPSAIHLVSRSGTDELLVGSWTSAPLDRPLPLRFSDGTELLLGPRSRARVIEASDTGAHVIVEAGSAKINVVPKQNADWKLSFGPFLVKVVGTKFSVDWNPDEDQFRLVLHEGRVHVSGCVLGDGRLLLPGDRLDASCKDSHFEISSGGARRHAADALAEPSGSAPQDPPPASSATPRASESAAVARGEPKRSARPTWRELARANSYAEAFAAATELGFGAECERASAEDLILLADAARFSGKPTPATQAYQTLRRRFAGTALASRAAFALARQAFDQRGAYAEAARWFETYLQEQPNGPFTREALGRLMESQNRAGDHARARQTAERYLVRYPKGPHSLVAQKLVGGKG
jgi:TolA-binding protein